MFLMAVGICSLLFCTYIKIKIRCAKKVKEQMTGCFKNFDKNGCGKQRFVFLFRFFPASVLHGKEKVSFTNAPLDLLM
jgi:hypothetical protein